MMTRFLLLALAACTASAFVPASSSPGFGVSTKLFAGSDDDFEGIDLEQLLGTKKFKKMQKKFKRKAKNRLKAEEESAIKELNREAHGAAVASNDASPAAGLKLLIW